jgi:hypothetical protein
MIMWRDKTVLLNVQSPQKHIHRYRDKKKKQDGGTQLKKNKKWFSREQSLQIRPHSQ